MQNHEIVSLPVLALKPPIHLWEHFFFTRVDDPMLAQAEALAARIARISRGRRTLLLSEMSEVVGKVGEFVVRAYCQGHLTMPWSSFVEEVNQTGGDRCDLLIDGFSIDVKTRRLHTDVTISPAFDLRVPATEVHKVQDVFILAGYCDLTRYGYVFGWCSWEELNSRPIRQDIKFPARCVPLADLHPMNTLETYLQTLAPRR